MATGDLHMNKILSIYTREGSNSDFYDPPTTPKAYCEIHDVFHKGGCIQAGAGRPLTVDQIKNLVTLISGPGLQINCFLPTEVLSWRTGLNSVDIAFWIRPRTHTISHCDIANKITTPFPGMIFQVHDHNLKVYALKTKRRPTPKTKLFHLPIWNVDSNCRVCTGNCTVPDNKELSYNAEAIMHKWIDLFFGSDFSHDHANAVYKKVNMLEFWSKLDGVKEFPLDVLLATRKTVSDMLEN